MHTVVRFRILLANERELWHTCRATSDRKFTSLPCYYAWKQSSLLMARGLDKVIC